MKKFYLLITVLLLLCFALTACGTTTEDILDAITGNSNLSAEVSTSSSAGGLSSQVPTQSREDSSETSKNNSSMPIYPVTSSNGKNSQSTVNSQSIPTKTEPTATVLLIDRSGGMCGEEGDNGFTGAYGKNRLQVIQEAFTKVLADGILTKNDYIGVIFFGGNKFTPIEALQLTSASNVLGISRAVNMDISAITGGKNYLSSNDWRHALEAATKMLAGFQSTDNKHIFMITDGAGDKAEGELGNLTGYPVGGWKYYGEKLPSGYTPPSGIPEKCYTNYIYDTYGITTSTLNVACPLSPAKEYIAELECNGATYYTQKPEEIENAISAECRRITSINANLPETSVSNSSTSASSSIEPSTSQAPNSSFVNEGFYVPTTPIPDGTSVNATILIMQINNTEVTSSNYKEVEVKIKEMEDFYKTLTPSEKAEVVNYQHLVLAREALDLIKNKVNAAEFVAIIDSLPEADSLKNKNVDAVYQAMAIYDEYRLYLSENVPNFTSYHQKLFACYNKIQDSVVEKAFISQDMDGNGIVDASELAMNKTRTDTEDGFFTILNSGGSSANPCIYNDRKNTNISLVRVYKGAVQFTADQAGTVTFYPRNTGRTFIITIDGVQIDGEWVASTSDPVTVKLPSAGVVKVTTTRGDLDAAFYAVNYSYPNLGD